MRWLVPLVLAAGLACGGRGGGGGAGPAPDPTTPVRVLRVAPTDTAWTLEGQGTVVAERSVVLKSEAAGLVSEVGFTHGDRVSAGAVLVRLVDGDARGAAAEAEAAVVLAEAQLGRTRALAERQNASPADLDRAAAEASLARARRDRARDAVRRTVVRAPFAGVVGLRGVSRGDLLQPGSVITTITDLSALSVDVAVSERELAGLAPGMAASVTVDAVPGLTQAAQVVFVSPELDRGTRTGVVRVALTDPDPAVRPGSTARVAFAGSTVAALQVPTQAVLATARGSAVYVVDADGAAQLRPVVTADRDSASVRVVDGLVAGDAVVVEGLVRLRPGAKVRILEQATP